MLSMTSFSQICGRPHHYEVGSRNQSTYVGSTVDTLSLKLLYNKYRPRVYRIEIMHGWPLLSPDSLRDVGLLRHFKLPILVKVCIQTTLYALHPAIGGVAAGP
jgi:hypothetical protein